MTLLMLNNFFLMTALYVESTNKCKMPLIPLPNAAPSSEQTLRPQEPRLWSAGRTQQSIKDNIVPFIHISEKSRIKELNTRYINKPFWKRFLTVLLVNTWKLSHGRRYIYRYVCESQKLGDETSEITDKNKSSPFLRCSVIVTNSLTTY